MAETTALTRQDPAPLSELSVQAVIDRKRKIQEVMDGVMKEGDHFGTIPGCGDKPTLYKSGAEVLAFTFGLAPRFDVQRIDLPGGHREYQVTCTMRHAASGIDLGEGVGACSSMESKYRWRKAERKCPECGKAAIIKGRAEFGGGWLCFGKKGGCGMKWGEGDKTIEDQEVGRVENPDPADTFNTVLKIAKKRAQVDATLTVTGASDLLTQDLEDLPPGSAQVQEVQVSGESPKDAKSGQARQRDPKPWIADLAACHTEAEVKALAPKFNKMQKGSPERAEAMEAFKRRLAQVQEDVLERDVIRRESEADRDEPDDLGPPPGIG